MAENFRPKIEIFYCINTFGEIDDLHLSDHGGCDITGIKMACSSMVKDVFLLKAFEAGADGVVVLVCPEGQCRYVEGNIRAKKRVKWVQNLLDEIELDGRRLSIKNISPGDNAAAEQIIDDVLKNLAELGPNPAA